MNEFKMYKNGSQSSYFGPDDDSSASQIQRSRQNSDWPGFTKDDYRLSFFTASVFAAVLEDSITEMRILEECNSSSRVFKAMIDLYHLRALKYKVELPKQTDELDGIDHKRLHCTEYKINKLDADRLSMRNTLISTYLDLTLRKSYKYLYTEICRTEEQTASYFLLLDEEMKNRLIRRDLGKQIRQQRNHVKSVYYDNNTIIEDLKTQVEDAALVAETRSRYVGCWQVARSEQHNQKIKGKESATSEKIEFYKQRNDHEQRVHNEIELLTNIFINEILQKVEDWMTKYEKDMEAMDLKIQIMKNKHINMLEKREGLENTIEKHSNLINDWVNFKDEREKARQYREKMTNAAIAVQAWWRGLLVRNQLGPYKPPPKKKGGGSEKKKK